MKARQQKSLRSDPGERWLPGQGYFFATISSTNRAKQRGETESNIFEWYRHRYKYILYIIYAFLCRGDIYIQRVFKCKYININIYIFISTYTQTFIYTFFNFCTQNTHKKTLLWIFSHLCVTVWLCLLAANFSLEHSTNHGYKVGRNGDWWYKAKTTFTIVLWKPCYSISTIYRLIKEELLLGYLKSQIENNTMCVNVCCKKIN